LDQAKSKGSLALPAVPGAGTSELLRQTYDRLFADENSPAPFYFEIKPSDATAPNVARRFLSEFLLQTVAFRRSDARLMDVSPDIDELAALALPSDGVWIDRLIETYHSTGKATDDMAVRNCLSAPLRVAANGVRSFVMIDGLHTAPDLTGGEKFIDDLIDVFSRAAVPFVFAGHRRFLFARTPFATMPVEALSFSDAGKVVERLSADFCVAINDQTRDLIAVQLDGNVTMVNSLIAGAAASGRDLKTFEQVEQVYTDQVFGGRIAKHFDSVLDRVFPDHGVQLNILGLLFRTLTANDARISVEYWRKHAALTGPELADALEALRVSEIVDVSSGIVHVDPSNVVLADYLLGRVRLEIDGDPRALAVGEVLSENVKRAPELMARFYRRRSRIGLRELLVAFDGRQVSPALIDYSRFKDEFKGIVDEKVVKALKEDNVRVTLPQIVYTAHTGDFYSKLNELCDIEASAVALGFTYEDGQHETAWIAVEIESKLEATRETAEFWCDRLEMAAINCNFDRFNLWLIAPEGFTPEAMAVLRARNAYGSSRKQVELLGGILGAEIAAKPANADNEYEFVFPMGENTEMLAAHTVEEIARRHAFPAKATNQIKTALVEACINAAEHSLSPDRKIYQRVVVDDEKISITVSNRGVRLADKLPKEAAPEEGRRGWGLKLIKGLMDDVRVEQVDDGTRITMVKYLKSR
jgi:serine/threonine-protein kinase RsbW